MSDTLYLETTAVIDASFKSFPQLLNLIKESRRTISSQYVKMEIKKGFLYHLVLLHNKTVQCESFAQVQQYVANLASSPKRYYLGAVLDALRVLWQEIESQRPSDLIAKHGDIPIGSILRSDTINFLRFWIRMLLLKIDKMVVEVVNPLQCFKDLSSPVLKGDVFDNNPAHCSKSAVECKIHEFFENNKTEFEAIRSKLRSLPSNETDNETKGRISALKKIGKKKYRPAALFQSFSNLAQNADLCWACGDAIHAVIAPEESYLVNRNEKHYKVICEAIRRNCLAYKSPSV